MSNDQRFGIIRYNNNPGSIAGYVVYSEIEQRESDETDYNRIIGYEWEEEDIGSWMGTRRVQRPIYAKKIVRVCTWIAIPECNVQAWESQYD